MSGETTNAEKADDTIKQLTSCHALCGVYRNAEQAQLTSILDRNAREKDLSDYERGFITVAAMAGQRLLHVQLGTGTKVDSAL